MVKIANGFSIGKSGIKSYIGLVMLDQENLYLAIGMNKMSGMFGAAGFLIFSAIAAATRNGSSQPHETTIGELPSDVRNHPAWPRIADKARVIVVPREAVTLFTASRWTGWTLWVGESKFKIDVSMFRLAKTKGLLAEYGWIVI